MKVTCNKGFYNYISILFVLLILLLCFDRLWTKGVALNTGDAVNVPDKLKLSGKFTAGMKIDSFSFFYYVFVLLTIPQEQF